MADSWIESLRTNTSSKTLRDWVDHVELGEPTSDDHRCRFNRPAAVLHETTKYQYDFTDFIDRDRQAAALYAAMLAEIKELGMAIRQNKDSTGEIGDGQIYRAPIGERALRKVERRWPFVPWCGELVIEGGDEVRGVAV